MEINEKKPNENKQAVLFLAWYMARESATVMCFLEELQSRQRSVDVLSGERGRLQVSPDWRLLAWEG